MVTATVFVAGWPCYSFALCLRVIADWKVHSRMGSRLLLLLDQCYDERASVNTRRCSCHFVILAAVIGSSRYCLTAEPVRCDDSCCSSYCWVSEEVGIDPGAREGISAGDPGGDVEGSSGSVSAVLTS